MKKFIKCPITGEMVEHKANTAFQVKVAPNVILTCHPFEVSDDGIVVVPTELSSAAQEQIRAKLAPPAATTPKK